jgi:tetratricopeptide (TPR) repeat protein
MSINISFDIHKIKNNASYILSKAKTILQVLSIIFAVFAQFFFLHGHCGAQVNKNTDKIQRDDISKISPDRYFNEAYQRYKEKDLDAAIELFKMAIVDNPDNFMAYFYLSNIYLERKMYEQAESIMSVASHIKLNASDAEKAFAGSGGTMNETEIIRYKQSARFNYKEALKLLSDGQWHEAVKLLQNASNMEPDNELYIVKIAEVFHDMQNISKARAYFKKVLAINPDNQMALKKLARIYHADKEYAGANELYNRLYKLSGEQKYLSLMNECSEKENRGARESLSVILKRRGRSVFVDMGYNKGLQMGDTITKRLLVYRSKNNSEIKDPRSTKVIGYERPVIAGELLVTRIENDYCEALISNETNGGIMIGDEVRWKE